MAENLAPTTRTMNADFSISDHNNNNNDSTFSTSSNLVPATDHRPSKRLDLAAIARSKRYSTSPMKDRNQNHQEEQTGHFDFLSIDNPMKSRLQLVSPPPEEDLAFMRVAGNSHSRSNSTSTSFTPSTKKTPSKSSTNPKRKRNTQTSSQAFNAINGESSTQMDPVEATPNPKPRKQGRHVRLQSVDSPTKPTFSGASPTSSGSKISPAEPTTPSRSKPKNLLVQSPHVNNPDADYLPPLPALALTSNPARRAVLGSRRRSATPIPHYEPPTDVFTPPRQVFINPPPKEGANRSASRAKSAATSSRRKSQSAKKTTTLRIHTAPPVIKLEMPDIDLSEPMPPPSPTDDPLLLSGPPEPPKTSPVRHREASVQVVEIPPYNPRRISPRPTTLASTPFCNTPPQRITFANDLPPSSPEPPLDSEDAQAINEFTSHRDVQVPFDSSDDSMMQLDDPLDANVSPVNLFNFDGPPDSGSWSDSDTETTANFETTLESTQRKVAKHASLQDVGTLEGEGEYTGRWRMMTIRTKMDPPSSATRVRMEDWGRPISPFPYPKVKRLSFLSEGEDEDDEIQTQVAEQVQDQSFEAEQEEEREVARLSMEPEEDAARLALEEKEELLDNDHSMTEVQAEPGHEADTSQEQEEEEEERQVREMSMSLSDNEDEEEEREVREMSMEVSEDENEQEDEQPLVLPARIPSVPRELSRPPAPAPEVKVQAQVQITTQQEPEPEPQSEHFDSQPPRPRQEIPHFLIDEDSPMGQPFNESRARFDGTPEDGDESTDTDDDPGLVKIISSDPRAAARAAAILKQHDYECYTKLIKRKHLSKNTSRHSFSFTDANDIARESRRRDLSASGITKQRRRSTMGVMGDKVIIPGSPVRTLPELLLEAEHEISFAEKSFHAHEHSHIHISQPKDRDPFKTPLPSQSHKRPRLSHYEYPFNYGSSDGPREWTKDEWKLLDACFTDQRVFLAEHLGLDEELAPVDIINLEDVVQRFVDLVGGEELISGFGDNWDRESLLARTQALQKKQRSGKVAPPTTPYVSPSRRISPRPSGAAESPAIVREAAETQNPLGELQRLATMKVPDFTPLGRRATKTSKKGLSTLSTLVLPEPIRDETAPFSNLPPEKDEDRSMRRKMPSVLHAPRYSHLMEEAAEVSRDLGSFTADVSGEGDSRQSEQSMEEGVSQYTEGNSSILSGLNDSADHSHSSSRQEEEEAAPQGMAKRVTGFIYSYLGRSKQPEPVSKHKLTSRQCGLPLPPRSVLEKPRGPVITPAKPPPAKGPAPRDLVNLNPAPLPKPSKLPTQRKPKRLVDLHPAPPPVENPKDLEKEALLRRRSSTSSVKDLIGGFEAMQKKAKEEEELRRKTNLKRVTSRGADKEKEKPRWRF